jgi:hypothetical protein
VRLGAVAALLLVFGCDRSLQPLSGSTRPSASPSTQERASPSEARTPTARAGVRCAHDESFPTTWKVAEASAAVEVTLVPGTRELLVISDSGNGGEALLWAIPHGPFRPIRLPLDAAASDDNEGAAWLSGHLYTLTSSGAVRRFSPDGHGGLRRDDDAYAIGPPPYTCPSLTDFNCGYNYEGLCLRAQPSGARCAGYAASKTVGRLFCLVFDGERIRLDTIKPPLVLDVPRTAVSDCAFGAADGPGRDVLLVTTNVYGGSTTYEVNEASGALRPLDVVGLPNNEAVAIGSDGAFYEFMDSDSSTSLADRLTCEGWPQSEEAGTSAHSGSAQSK